MKYSRKPHVIKDYLGMGDQVGSGGLRGEIIIGKNRQVEEFTDPFGNKSWRTTFGEILMRDENIVRLAPTSLFLANCLT
jgi:hypothetical protein